MTSTVSFTFLIDLRTTKHLFFVTNSRVYFVTQLSSDLILRKEYKSIKQSNKGKFQFGLHSSTAYLACNRNALFFLPNTTGENLDHCCLRNM